ncbi:MAG TPA: hypothetical protein VFZ53_01040 [Polyangiaceae bacterium]
MTAKRSGVHALACAAAFAACEPVTTSVGSWERETSLYLEAEQGELSGGFSIGEDPEASEERFIAPPPGVTSDAEPGSARAVYAFSAAIEGDYVFWGRLRSPGALENRFWIRVDDGPWTKWRISVGDIWFWDDVHDDVSYGTPLVFPLSSGDHTLVVANAVDGVALDRLFLSPSGESPPGNATSCNPPHSIERDGECLPSCGSLNGTACDEVTCAGRELLDAYDCGVCCRVEP